jgi:TRAP-type C4-dicarboxylate transport system permease small subunit
MSDNVSSGTLNIETLLAPEHQVRTREPMWVRVIEWGSRILGMIGAAAIGLMALHVFLDVIARNLFGRGFPGTLDFVQYWWMPMAAVMPMALAELKNEHITVTIMTEKLQGFAKRFFDTLTGVLSLVIVAAITYYSSFSAVHAMERGEKALGAAWLPVWPIRIVLIAGLALFTLQLVVTVYRSVMGRAASVPTIAPGLE